MLFYSDLLHLQKLRYNRQCLAVCQSVLTPVIAVFYPAATHGKGLPEPIIRESLISFSGYYDDKKFYQTGIFLLQLFYELLY